MLKLISIFELIFITIYIITKLIMALVPLVAVVVIVVVMIMVAIIIMMKMKVIMDSNNNSGDNNANNKVLERNQHYQQWKDCHSSMWRTDKREHYRHRNEWMQYDRNC